jgi:hypothetical protein
VLLILVIPSSTASSFKGFYFRFGIKVVATGMLTLIVPRHKSRILLPVGLVLVVLLLVAKEQVARGKIVSSTCSYCTSFSL